MNLPLEISIQNIPVGLCQNVTLLYSVLLAQLGRINPNWWDDRSQIWRAVSVLTRSILIESILIESILIESILLMKFTLTLSSPNQVTLCSCMY